MTEAEYKAALKRAEELMDAQRGTPEAAELDRLADAIMTYEDEHFAFEDERSCTCGDFLGEDPNCKLHHATDI